MPFTQEFLSCCYFRGKKKQNKQPYPFHPFSLQPKKHTAFFWSKLHLWMRWIPPLSKGRGKTSSQDLEQRGCSHQLNVSCTKELHRDLLQPTSTRGKKCDKRKKWQNTLQNSILQHKESLILCTKVLINALEYFHIIL